MNGYEQLRKAITDVAKGHVDSSNNLFIGTVKSLSPFMIHNYATGDIKKEQLSVLRSALRNRDDPSFASRLFKVGDMILFMIVENGDKQHFIILDKVVKL